MKSIVLSISSNRFVCLHEQIILHDGKFFGLQVIFALFFLFDNKIPCLQEQVVPQDGPRPNAAWPNRQAIQPASQSAS